MAKRKSKAPDIGPDCPDDGYTYTDPPAWVMAVIDRVAQEAGRSIRPQVMWTIDCDDGLNGMASAPGYDAWFPDGMVWLSEIGFATHTVLHEMAHWLCPPDEDHGKAFFMKCFPLYVQYGVRFEDWEEREDWWDAQCEGLDLEKMWKKCGGKV
jgi:hypothetical protein